MQMLHHGLPMKAQVSCAELMRVLMSMRVHASRLNSRTEFQFLTQGPVVLLSKFAGTCC